MQRRRRKGAGNREECMRLRSEVVGDAAEIRRLIDAAFAEAEHSSGTESAIVDALREAGALTVSLAAEAEGRIVGHVAFSPVTIGDTAGWFGLGPVSVDRAHRRQGIGAALIRQGLGLLKEARAGGCVVLGDPHYYRRFGFEQDPGLRFEGAPPEYFMRLTLAGTTPAGPVAYHPAFYQA
jgi:putative acetyltransferase